MPAITFAIQRFDPEKDSAPRRQDFAFDVQDGWTILDCLNHIKERLDASLAFRASCRMAICGSCAVLADGLPRLACETQVLPLGKPVLSIAPLPNYPLIKDLVVDFSGFFARHCQVKPYIVAPAGAATAPAEHLQTPAELSLYQQFSYCTKCGICFAACPTAATDREFPGPQALAQAYRYLADTRDSGAGERSAALDQPHGAWRCHMAGSCAEACPKGVDPALAIQLLKRELLFGGKQQQAPLAPPQENPPVKTNIAPPPPRTIVEPK